MALTRIDLRLYARILAILTKYGKDSTFTLENKFYDPTTGNVSSDGPITYQLKITPPAPIEQMLPKESLATDLAGKTIVFFAAKNLEFVPVPGVKLTIDDDTWTIMPPLKTWYTGQLKALYGAIIER